MQGSKTLTKPYRHLLDQTVLLKNKTRENHGIKQKQNEGKGLKLISFVYRSMAFWFPDNTGLKNFRMYLGQHWWKFAEGSEREHIPEYILKQRGHHKNCGPQIQAKGIDSKPKLFSWIATSKPFVCMHTCAHTCAWGGGKFCFNWKWES